MDEILEHQWETKDNVCFLSQPGLGKTKKIEGWMQAKADADPKFGRIWFDGGTLSPTDTVMSMPNIGEQTIDRLLARDLLPATVPGTYGVIYIGEWPLMSGEVSRGWQKMMNHEWFNGKRIEPGWLIVSDGQRMVDKSFVNVQSRAIWNRFVVFNMEFDIEYALDIVKQHYHTEVAAYCIRNPQHVDNYSDVFESTRETNDLTAQEGKHGIWASLRSWDKVSRLLHVTPKPYEEELVARVGSGVATSFSIFRKMLDKLATREQINKNPQGAPVPEKMDECWALLTMLALTVNKEDFKPVSVYMHRYKTEHQIAFFRLMQEQLAKRNDGSSSAIRATKEYLSWISEDHISKMLKGATK
jgi:hypothetical protein